MASVKPQGASDKHGFRWLQLVLGATVFGLAVTAGGAQTTDPGNAPGDSQAQVAAGSEAAQGPAADPPSRVVRLGLLQGNVSVEPGSVNTFSPGELNQVLTTGDRVYTDTGANAELQAGQISLRMGGATDLTITAMTDQLAQFGLASGSVHLRSVQVPAGTVLEIDSPEAAMTVLQPGDLRVDEDATNHATTVTVLTGQVEVDGPNLSQQLNAGDRLRIHAGNGDEQQGAYAEPLPQSTPDSLDAFSDARDSVYANGLQASEGLVSPDTIGGADLASYGTWDTDEDFGPVWFPTVVVGWRPYCDGHWRWVAPWGWTWVGNEPWAFAPFHYGRWALVNGHWGWVPGVPTLRPVYAPALVTFVGGRQFSASLGYAPGSGVAAWFPLGPHEPFQPWYHGSTSYLNRVNASNLYNANAAEARAFYNQRAVNVFAGEGRPSHTYANRLAGTVAMSQASFAGGQPVARNQLQIPATQLAEAPILQHPAVSPERWMVVTGKPRALPAQNEHRTFAGTGDGRPSEGGSPRSAEYANRPAFVHAQTPPGPRPSFEEQRQAMERGEPGRPVAPAQGLENQHQLRPGGLPGARESGLRPAGPPATGPRPGPSPAPAPRPSAEPPRAAPATPAGPAGRK